MNGYGYVLQASKAKTEKARRYHREDLELMTTYQLNEICRQEQLVRALMDPLDKEELIRLILRYRGADEYYLIRKHSESGRAAVESALKTIKMSEKPGIGLINSSHIVAYESLAIGFYDGLTLRYDPAVAGTNAFVTDGRGHLCAILNVEAKGEDTSCLYLTKVAELPVSVSADKNYSLICLERRDSELFYRLYRGGRVSLPGSLTVCRIPLLDFEVRAPRQLETPLAMDFGSTNTTAGVYLEAQYFERNGQAMQPGEPGLPPGLKKNAANYLTFYDVTNHWQETPLFPSVISVRSVGQEGTGPQLLFGYEAQRLADSSYIDEGFCVFYDIKRWVGNYDKMEEITDREGHSSLISRKEILKAYFEHIIKEAANQFKCAISSLHISCPVKQKTLFQNLFRSIFPGYDLAGDMLDEGVSVIYNTIAAMIREDKINYGEAYQALIIDCGGGTTDLCACTFRVTDQRIRYRIDIDTAYENGNTDFGGNNLTYRILQWLKIAAARALGSRISLSAKAILAGLDVDTYFEVDDYGVKKLYRQLEEEYARAEQFLPTRFREYRSKSRAEYYMVKNNYYFLFHLAESVKKSFYQRSRPKRLVIASARPEDQTILWLPADKWKLSVRGKEGLETIKEFPAIRLESYDIDLLLKGDIYDLIRRFMEHLDEENGVENYDLIKLTGQSCKIDTFRAALTEFVPGRLIRVRRRAGEDRNELKLACVDGALRFLNDKHYGYADITIRTGEPALPYTVAAYTHKGEEVVLIPRLKRGCESGMISRNMERLTLLLSLLDEDGQERYQYTCRTDTADFREVSYEDIRAGYGNHIRQKDTDDIVEREVKFFVWSLADEWAFAVVPVGRKSEQLYLGKEEVFYYENDNWVRNFFDGSK